MESIGVRKLRQDASRYLHRVEAGESFRITDRGRPVAVLMRAEELSVHSAAALLDELVAAGVYPDVEAALAHGVTALSRLLRRRAVDREVVAGYERMPQESDAWIDGATQVGLAALDRW